MGNGVEGERGRFAAATAVTPSGGGVYVGEVADGWDINGNANGGYLLAVVARALAAVTGRPDPVTVTAHYLSPGKVGPATVTTEVLKQGKRFATARATLTGHGKSVITALGSFSDLSGGDDEIALVDGAPPDLPPPERCVPRSSSQTGPAANFSSRLDLRLHPDDAGWDRGEPSGQALVRGWFRLHDDEPIDTIALLCAVDAFPPTAFNTHLPVAWTPTVELTAHVRARPAPGWLRCAFSTRFVTGGFLEEDGEVWDGTGRLVAQSRQLALMARA